LPSASVRPASPTSRSDPTFRLTGGFRGGVASDVGGAADGAAGALVTGAGAAGDAAGAGSRLPRTSAKSSTRESGRRARGDWRTRSAAPVIIRSPYPGGAVPELRARRTCFERGTEAHGARIDAPLTTQEPTSTT